MEMDENQRNTAKSDGFLYLLCIASLSLLWVIHPIIAIVVLVVVLVAFLGNHDNEQM